MTKTVKKLQQQSKDLNSRIDEEIRQREEQHQLANKAEKRANDLTVEIEELRSNVDQVNIAVLYMYMYFYTCTLHVHVYPSKLMYIVLLYMYMYMCIYTFTVLYICHL